MEVLYCDIQYIKLIIVGLQMHQPKSDIYIKNCLATLHTQINHTLQKQDFVCS